MPGCNIVRRIAVLFCLALTALAGTVQIHAGEESSSENSELTITNQPTFSAEVRDVGGRGFRTSRCVYVNMGVARFSFRVPEGSRASTATEDRINVIKNDYSCVVSLRAATGECATQNPQRLKEALLGRFPDMRLTGERSIMAADNTGPAFDFIHESDGLKRKTRVAFVPSAAGILEFKMTTAPDTFEANQDIFNEIVNTFRASKPNGDLEVVRLADNS